MGLLFTTGPTVGKRTSTRPPNLTFQDPPGPNANRGVGSPFLPFDAPPRPSTLPPITQRGLTTVANLHGTSPVPHPYAPYSSSETFPLAMESLVGPAAIGTRIGVAVNTYSPSTHWRGRQAAELVTAAAVKPNPFIGRAKGSRRLQGRVVTFPFATPAWTTSTGRTVS